MSWLTAEGPGAFGSLTLWEGGDLAVEIFEAEHGSDVGIYRGQAVTTTDLGPHLTALVRTCAGPKESELTVCTWPVVGPDLADCPLASPHLRL